MRNLTVVSLASLLLNPFAAFASHETDVVAKIDSYLQQGFSKSGSLPTSMRIQMALAQATDARAADTKNTVLRDAEYYLHGLYAMTAKDVAHGVPTAGAPVYDALKWAAFQLKDNGYDWLEKWMRTDPDKPLSEPGGASWALRGLRDGVKVDGDRGGGPVEYNAFLANR